MSSFLRYLTAPIRAIAALPRWFLGLSVPARAALLVAIFCVLCVVIATIAYYLNPQLVTQPIVKGWKFWLVVVLLIVAIPLVVWYALKLWLEGEVSRYPDIDYAWKAGIEALERHGLDLREIPLFLIIGVEGDAAAASLLQASRISFRVQEVPQGPAALHWYANPEGIYLVCTETCSLSALAKVGGRLVEHRPAPAAASAPGRQDAVRATVVPGDVDTYEETSQRPVTPAAQGDIRGTMNIGAGSPGQTMLPFEAGVPERPVPKLPTEELAECSRRLEYLCRRLSRARDPLCPINGALTLLPYQVIETGPGGGLEVRKAVREDLRVATRSLQLQFPVTALVVGMQTEDGFRELVRRVGVDKAREQRFGKGFGASDASGATSRPALASAEQLAAVGAHACGAFEDWVYALFRARDALSQPGNSKLYSLLCKVRLHLQDRLASILGSAYTGSDQDSAGAPFFSGCYFAATGWDEQSQAFIKSVFDKLTDQQEDVEWTDQALRDESRLRTVAYIALVFDVLLALAIAAALIAQQGT